MVTILIMSAKLTNIDPLKMKIFWNKGYDFIIFAHNVTKNILSRDWNYTVDMVMWPKFGNSSISVSEVIITLILYGIEQKTNFLRDAFGSSSIIWNLNFYPSVEKYLKLKFRKFRGLIPTFVEATGEKLIGGFFCSPILNRVNMSHVNGLFLYPLWFFNVSRQFRTRPCQQMSKLG